MSVATGDATVARTPTVSIVVPVVRGDDDFRACLASVARLEPPCDELVVAVDGGDESAAALARAEGARVVVLQTPGGPARARNAAAHGAAGDILFFVDADVTVPPDAVARVRSAFADHPGHAAIVGSYDQSPAATNFLSQYKNLAHRFVHQTSRDEACAFWGACGAIRREAFLRAGGYDERYTRASIEDIELGSRLVASGERIGMVKSLSVTHLKRWTPGRLLRSEIFDRAVPWTRLILASRRMPDDLNLRWSGRAGVVVACALGVSLVATPWSGWAWLAAALFAALEILIDARLARFFLRARGLIFTARALACQWVHYLCCAAGFGLGAAAHLLGPRHRRPAAAVRARAGALAGEPEPK